MIKYNAHKELREKRVCLELQLNCKAVHNGQKGMAAESESRERDCILFAQENTEAAVGMCVTL